MVWQNCLSRLLFLDSSVCLLFLGQETVASGKSIGNIVGVDYLTSCTSRKCGRCDRRRSPARVAATAGLVAGQCPINEDSLTWLPRTSSPIQSSSTYHHHHQPQATATRCTIINEIITNINYIRISESNNVHT